MAETQIEWTDSTWNPVAGCSIVTAGCTHCYVMEMAKRRASINMPGCPERPVSEPWPAPIRWPGFEVRALSDEVDTGSAQESAPKQGLRAVFDCNAIGHGSSASSVG